jgi:hypothetical protein
MKKIITLVAFVAIIATACGDSGYSQQEVDAIVDEAVSEALADAEDSAAAAEEAEEAAKQEKLLSARDSCGLEYNAYVDVDEAGMAIEGEGQEDRGLKMDKVWCILDQLDLPDSIKTRMRSTTALQGVVEGQWGDYEASWTYHPDNGLDIFIAVQS